MEEDAVKNSSEDEDLDFTTRIPTTWEEMQAKLDHIAFSKRQKQESEHKMKALVDPFGVWEISSSDDDDVDDEDAENLPQEFTKSSSYISRSLKRKSVSLKQTRRNSSQIHKNFSLMKKLQEEKDNKKRSIRKKLWEISKSLMREKKSSNCSEIDIRNENFDPKKFLRIVHSDMPLQCIVGVNCRNDGNQKKKKKKVKPRAEATASSSLNQEIQYRDSGNSTFFFNESSTNRNSISRKNSQKWLDPLKFLEKSKRKLQIRMKRFAFTNVSNLLSCRDTVAKVYTEGFKDSLETDQLQIQSEKGDSNQKSHKISISCDNKVLNHMIQVQKTQESLWKHEKKIFKSNEDEKSEIDALLKEGLLTERFVSEIESGFKNLEKIAGSQLGVLCENSKKIEEISETLKNFPKKIKQ